MKLEKKDIAEAFGMVYNGTCWNEEDNHVHYFQCFGKDIYIGLWYDIDEAWEQAADKLLEPLVELLKSKLTA